MSKIKICIFLILSCLFLIISNIYAKDVSPVSSGTVVKQTYNTEKEHVYLYAVGDKDYSFLISKNGISQDSVLKALEISTTSKVSVIKTNADKIINMPKSEIDASAHIDNEDNLVISESFSNITYSKSGSAVANITAMPSKIPTITVSSGVTFSNNISYVSGTILNSITGILKIYSDEENRTTFLSNIVFESGGAIYNLNLTSVTTIGAYSQFSSNTATNAGGAIYSMGNLEIEDNVDFYGNGYNSSYYYTEGSISTFSVTISSINKVIDISKTNTNILDGSNVLTGGAVYQNGGSSDTAKQKWLSIGENVTFNGNYAYDGGAIYAVLSSVTISSANFTGNKANHNGGAVYVFKSTFTLNGGSVTSNSAAKRGGAIYSYDSILNLNATNNAIVFDDNKATDTDSGGAIHAVNGEINLNADNNNISFKNGNSIVSTGTAVMNIETATNYVDFDADVDIVGGTITFKSGEIKISSNCDVFNAGTLILSSGTFSLSTGTMKNNPNIIQKVTVDTFTSTENVNLSIDVTVDKSTNTNIINDSFKINKTASGVINLNKINISSLPANKNNGTITLFDGDGDLEALRVKISTKSVYSNKTYAFFQSPDLGVLDFSTMTVISSSQSLKNFLNSLETRAARISTNKVLTASGTITNHLALYNKKNNENESIKIDINISSSGALSLIGDEKEIIVNAVNKNLTNEGYLYMENVTCQFGMDIKNSCEVFIDSDAIDTSSSSLSTVRLIVYDSSFSSASIMNVSSVTVKNTDKADKKDFGVNLKVSSVSFDGQSKYKGIYSNTYINIDSVTNSNINNRIINKIEHSTFKNNTADDGGAIYSGINGISVSGGTDTSKAVVIESDIEYKIGDGVKFISNSANNGGAIYSSNTITEDQIEKLLEIKDSSFTSKMVYSLGNVVEFSHNDAQYGGAIYNYVQNSSNSVVFNTEFTIGANAKFVSNGTTTVAGGAIYNKNGTIDFKDGVAFISNSAMFGGAIYNSSGTINLTAKENDIIFDGNKGFGGAIYNSGGIINFVVYSTSSIIFKTNTDTIVSIDTTSVININEGITQEKAGTVIINADMSYFEGTTNINSGIFKFGDTGQLFGGKTIIENAIFDFSSEETKESGNKIKNYDLSNFTINKNLNLVVDVDLQDKKMDTISSSKNIGSGSIYIKEFNLISTTSAKSVDILFTSSTALKGKVSSVSKITTPTATSSEYIYDVGYDKNTGYFTFTNRDVANPTTLEGTVAMLAGNLATQENVLNQAFVSMNTSFTNRHDRRMDLIENSKNLYASTENFIYFDRSKIEGGFWLRPYAYQEKVSIAGYDTDNTIYGALAGIDLKLTDYKLLSFYIGYTGVNQNFENIKVDQNGYVFGVTGMHVKENFYIGLTANAGVTDTKAESAKGTDDFQINTYIVGLKGGYEIQTGNWIFDPNLTLMYGFYGVENYQTKQGAKVAEDSINNFHIEPQIKIKLDLVDGWKPYALLGYIFNTGKTSTQVNGNNKKEEGIDPYYEYGAGLEKSFIGTPWVGYVQVTGKNGGKTGVGLNLGVKYAF